MDVVPNVRSHINVTVYKKYIVIRLHCADPKTIHYLYKGHFCTSTKANKTSLKLRE